MKNINEGIFDLMKKEKPKTGAITAADATKPIKPNDAKKSSIVATLKNHKITYLKQAAIFINAFNKTDGEDEERVLDKTVVAYKNYLVKMASTIKKTAQLGVDKLGIKPLASWWVNLFNAVDNFKGDVANLIQLYNKTIDESKLSVKKITDKPIDKPIDKPTEKKEKNAADGWVDLLNNPKALADVGTSFSKKLERFVEIFGLNESFINKMLEELDFEEEKKDDFEEALEFIILARTGERDIGKVLKAWKDANPDKYKEKITKYYDKIKDEKKKARFEAAISGKSSESTDKTEKSSDDKSSDEKSSEGESETLTLNKTKFIQGMKKISDNPDRFKKINREVLDASEGSAAYLSWDEFKKILAYIQNPESTEEKIRDTASDIRSRLGSEE